MSLFKKINKAYWAVEDWLSAHWIKLRIIVGLGFIFMLFAQANYISDKTTDVSRLPQEMQERYEYVCSEQRRLWAKQSFLEQRFEFDKAKEINKIRGPLNIECNKIANSAPRASWAYNFYVAIGAIKPDKNHPIKNSLKE